jgi:hypothetical protein
MVRVPLRAVVDVFASALKPTVPGPVPLAPAVTVSQPMLVVAVQSQPAGAVIVMLPVVPVLEIDCDVGVIE